MVGDFQNRQLGTSGGGAPSDQLVQLWDQLTLSLLDHGVMPAQLREAVAQTIRDRVDSRKDPVADAQKRYKDASGKIRQLGNRKLVLEQKQKQAETALRSMMLPMPIRSRYCTQAWVRLGWWHRLGMRKSTARLFWERPWDGLATLWMQLRPKHCRPCWNRTGVAQSARIGRTWSRWKRMMKMAISPAPVSQHRGFNGCDQFSTGPPQQQPVGSGPVVPPLSRFSMKSDDGSPLSALTSRSLVECFDWTSARARNDDEVFGDLCTGRISREVGPPRDSGCADARSDLLLFFANVTSWSAVAQSYFEHCRYPVVALVEHKQCDINPLGEFFAKRGFYLNAQPAEIKEVRPSGGCLVASRQHLNCQPMCLGSFRWAVSRCRMNGFDLVIVVAYFPVDGVYSVAYGQLLRDIGAFVAALRCPWVKVGDFNAEPVDLINSGWTRLVGGQLCFPTSPTISTGSTLDYMVLHRSLEGLADVRVVTSVPWKPHYGLEFTLRVAAMSHVIPTVINTQPTLASGPRKPWAFWATPDDDGDLEGGYSAWCKQAEGFLTSTSSDEVRGLGRKVEIVWVKRVEPVAVDALVRDSEVWFWSTLSRLVHDWRRLTDARQVGLRSMLLTKIVELTQRLNEFWGQVGHEPHGLTDASWAFSEPHRFSLKGMARLLRELPVVRDLLLGNLLETLTARGKHALAMLHRRRKHEFERKALKMREAHKILKRDEVAFIRPYQDKPVDERAALRRTFWVSIWGDTLVDFHPSKRLRHAALDQAVTLRPISSTQISKCLESMKLKKPGIDGWSLPALLQLPREGLSGLVWLFQRVERDLQWPSGIRQVGVALLPKDLDSERPISLTSFVYRLYFKLRGFPGRHGTAQSLELLFGTGSCSACCVEKSWCIVAVTRCACFWTSANFTTQSTGSCSLRKRLI